VEPAPADRPGDAVPRSIGGVYDPLATTVPPVLLLAPSTAVVR